MSSTGVNIGIASESRSSSRVLKPPGGGHTDIFGPAENKTQKPRAKNNQQNSSAMGEIMGKVDGKSEAPASQPEMVQPPSEPVRAPEPVKSVESGKPAESVRVVEASKPAEASGRVRVPPGGFSSGLW